mmetsp:Transcript_74102/g.217454  ORF Transcript_74102/g.217454 Transcript_74102/m.217454 type:complete len:273 (+) Transcript_74102:25-843(+)
MMPLWGAPCPRAVSAVSALLLPFFTLQGADAGWNGEDVRELHQQYYNIFRHGNRNAASHLWSKFLLDRSREMSREKLAYMFSGFCAVSGSPVQPQDRTRYRLTLDKVGGGKRTGYMYYCCWPCVCDTQDFIRVDTKNVTTSDGEVQLHFAVLGNPCDRPEELSKPFVQPFYGRSETTLRREAPEVRCDQDGKLEGAYTSDHGYIIISMFFDEDKSLKSMDETLFADNCRQRAEAGYNSGMGEIFRKVAAISPVKLAVLDGSCSSAPERSDKF